MWHPTCGELLDRMAKTLNLANSEIGALVGLSDRSLDLWWDWTLEVVPPGHKAHRLFRLGAVVVELLSYGLGGEEILSALLSGGVSVDTGDEENGTTSLVSYLAAFPEDEAWVAKVKEARDDCMAWRCQKAP